MIQPLPRVSSEATPHHLLLSLDTVSSDSMEDQIWYKMNPPLRTERERRDLLQCWPLIDVIASDHAPHTVSDKETDFSSAPSGVPGVETMMPLFMAKVYSGSISLADLIQKSVTRPAALLGIEPPGCSVGSRADLALYPDTITRIDGEKLHSKAGWSPFDGMEALFPSRVLIGGEVAYDASGDVFSKRETLWFCGKGLKEMAGER
jgi:dihydroorotase